MNMNIFTNNLIISCENLYNLIKCFNNIKLINDNNIIYKYLSIYLSTKQNYNLFDIIY